MKKKMIQLGQKLMIPFAVLAGTYFIFSDELQSFKYAYIIQYSLLVLALVGLLCTILESLDESSKKKNKK